MTFCKSSNISKNASLSISTFCNPNPTTTVLLSSGFLVAMKVAICDAYRCPKVSRCSPPPPMRVFGLRWPSGNMSSPAEGKAVSNAVGDALERGTCICEMLGKAQQDQGVADPL
jgi:hypothetical protein